ncbi:DUF3592 domain-containing protein [Curtobacterium sp. MCBA15_004]|uniref:DUF3592 domain-containing protein n=1 Tax=unclassified Curtobacterium TaxID=257496 RepID=UPI0008DD68C9|nr:DUF3592 domain-containing protein [Curtobacterium sp. MCBA15_004]WIA97390.1 hypothetical protein QOL16_03060 [Curtobacterium sp. MCBA15_004]
MSTVDPQQVRREREAAWRGTNRALVMTVVGAVLVAAAGAVAGLAVSRFVLVFRMMQVNSVFSDSPDPESVWWAAPGAVVGTLVAVAVYSRWNHRWSGRTSDFAGVGPLQPWFLGATAMLWWETSRWPAPDRVGVAVDPTFGHDEVWGLGEWIWYATVWWVPALATLVTVLLLVAGGVTRLGRGNRRARLTDVLANGRGVVGEVTAVSGGTSPDASRTLLRWTFSFVDLQGVRRWVERTEGFAHGEGPVVGMPVTVLYDPARPGDRKRIFTATTRDPGPEDFLRPGTS